MLKIAWSNGNLLTGETAATTVSAKVLKGEEDITSEYAASAFVWTRDTGDAAADATWNAAHNGVKEFTVNASELSADVKLTCTLTSTSPDYGTVYVDEDMNLIHAPAEADANDTLHLENCILSVETPNNEYHLDGNVLSVVRNRLNGSVTAEAWVYTAAPEKLVEFKYDSNGLRAQKKVTDHGQTVTTDYIYNGKQLVELTCGGDTLHFFYDGQNRPAHLAYNGQMYTYIHNLQGNIMGLIDNIGIHVIEYKYNAWGKQVEMTGSMANDLCGKNPFRYRSYVYDEETCLYYLRNRYYNMNYSRFLSVDQRIEAKSLYTYCCNSPIMYGDWNGTKEEGSDSSGDITDFIREGFSCILIQNAVSGSYLTYQDIAILYIPYEDIQYYNNYLYFKSSDPMDILVDGAKDEGRSYITTQLVETLGKTTKFSAFMNTLLSAFNIVEEYIRACKDEDMKKNHLAAQQLATDKKTGMFVVIEKTHSHFWRVDVTSPRGGEYITLWETTQIRYCEKGGIIDLLKSIIRR